MRLCVYGQKIKHKTLLNTIYYVQPGILVNNKVLYMLHGTIYCSYTIIHTCIFDFPRRHLDTIYKYI